MRPTRSSATWSCSTAPRARTSRARALQAGGLSGPAAGDRRRRAAQLRRARFPHRDRQRRHRHRRDRSRDHAQRARAAWPTRTAARSISSRPASPCSTPSQRLTFYNAAYRALWDLDAGYPRSAADRFRRARPAARGAQAARGAGLPRNGRRSCTRPIARIEAKEHTWHLPDGRTLRVVTTPNPDGGVTYLFDDVTERLDLERRFDALIRVQGETLDNLAEGVAVFGSDGRLRLHNPAFARMWRLDAAGAGRAAAHRDRDRACASRCTATTPIWQALRDAVTAIDSREADLRTARAPRRQRGRLHHGAAAGRRHAGDVPRRHRLGQRRARAARAQRGAGGRRPDQDRFRPSRVLRAALAAHQHHRLRPSAGRSGDRSARRRSSANISTTSRSRPTRCSRSSTTSSISPPSMPARMQLNLGPVDIRAHHGGRRRRRAGPPGRATASRSTSRAAPTSAASSPTSGACGRSCSICWPTRWASRRPAAPSRCAAERRAGRRGVLGHRPRARAFRPRCRSGCSTGSRPIRSARTIAAPGSAFRWCARSSSCTAAR